MKKLQLVSIFIYIINKIKASLQLAFPKKFYLFFIQTKVLGLLKTMLFDDFLGASMEYFYISPSGT